MSVYLIGQPTGLATWTSPAFYHPTGGRSSFSSYTFSHNLGRIPDHFQVYSTTGHQIYPDGDDDSRNGGWSGYRIDWANETQFSISHAGFYTFFPDTIYVKAFVLGGEHPTV